MRKMILIGRNSLNSFENAFAELLDEATRQVSLQLRNGPKSSPAPKRATENSIAPMPNRDSRPFGRLFRLKFQFSSSPQVAESTPQYEI